MKEINPPLAPDELVSTGTEREILEAFLEFHRGVVKRKLNGLQRRKLVAHWFRRLQPWPVSSSTSVLWRELGSSALSRNGQPT